MSGASYLSITKNKKAHFSNVSCAYFYRLVNNAGVALEPRRNMARCHETDEEVWDTTMKINAKSNFLGCKYAITQMLAQEPHSSGDRGWIINMSSLMGMVGGTGVRKQPVKSSHLTKILIRLKHLTPHRKEQSVA